MKAWQKGLWGIVVGALGCAIEVPDPDHFGSLPAAHDEPAPESDEESGADVDEGDDGEDVDATTGAADDGDDPGAVGSESGAPPIDDGPVDPSDDDGGESGSSDGGSDDGEPVDPGAQPLEGPWSSCLLGSECGAGMGCVNDGSDGFCSIACIGPNDPSACPQSPGGSATLGCILTAGTPVCVLDCSGGKTCPAGMGCVTETSDDGLIEICM